MVSVLNIAMISVISGEVTFRMSASSSFFYDVPLLLSVIDASKKSGVSRTELYRWIEVSAALPAGKVGTKWRIAWADLLAAVEGLPRVGE